jgi:hypothetical protein
MGVIGKCGLWFLVVVLFGIVKVLRTMKPEHRVLEASSARRCPNLRGTDAISTGILAASVDATDVVEGLQLQGMQWREPLPSPFNFDRHMQDERS